MRPSSIKKRQRYIEVATELFLERGFEGTGLDQLIERCGGSKLTIYSYFGDKKGLLKAVVMDLTEQLQQELIFEINESNDIRSQLMIFANRYIKSIYTPELLKLIRLVMTQTKNEPELVDFFLERGPFHSQNILHTFITEQHNLGRLTIDNKFLACDQLLGALKGNRYFEALFTDRLISEQEMTRYAEHAIDAFLRCYQAQ